MVDPGSVKWTGLRKLEQRSSGIKDYIQKACRKLGIPDELVSHFKWSLLWSFLANISYFHLDSMVFFDVLWSQLSGHLPSLISVLAVLTKGNIGTKIFFKLTRNPLARLAVLIVFSCCSWYIFCGSNMDTPTPFIWSYGYYFNSLHAWKVFMLMLYAADIRVSNCLDSDQDQHSVSPDLGPNYLQR